MSLRGLLKTVASLSEYGDLKSRLLDGKGPAGVTLLDAAKPPLLAALWREARRPFLVVTARPEAARQLHDQLSVYNGPDASIQLLPEPDYLPYERLASDKSTVQQRLDVLAGLAGAVQRPPPLIVASAYAVASTSIHPRRFLEATMTVSRGGRIELIELLRRWQALGYEMEDTVEVPGAMSRRGGIVDVFPPIYDRPAPDRAPGRHGGEHTPLRPRHPALRGAGAVHHDRPGHGDVALGARRSPGRIGPARL